MASVIPARLVLAVEESGNPPTQAIADTSCVGVTLNREVPDVRGGGSTTQACLSSRAIRKTIDREILRYVDRFAPFAKPGKSRPGDASIPVGEATAHRHRRESR